MHTPLQSLQGLLCRENCSRFLSHPLFSFVKRANKPAAGRKGGREERKWCPEGPGPLAWSLSHKCFWTYLQETPGEGHCQSWLLSRVFLRAQAVRQGRQNPGKEIFKVRNPEDQTLLYLLAPWSFHSLILQTADYCTFQEFICSTLLWLDWGIQACKKLQSFERYWGCSGTETHLQYWGVSV